MEEAEHHENEVGGMNRPSVAAAAVNGDDSSAAMTPTPRSAPLLAPSDPAATALPLCNKKRKRQEWKAYKKLLQFLSPSPCPLPTSPLPALPLFTSLPPPSHLLHLSPSDLHSLVSLHSSLALQLSEASTSTTTHHRHVLPYPFTHTTAIRPRHAGLPLLAFLTSQYVAYPPSYFQRAIAARRILLDGAPASPTTLLPSHSTLTHVTHRHEPPVPLLPPSPLLPSPHPHRPLLLLLHKPPGIPLHPSGQHRHSSLLPTLARLLRTPLYPLYRLDLAVSGVLLVARLPCEVRRMGGLMREGKVRKMYVAKVRGRMGEGRVECRAAIGEVKQEAGKGRGRGVKYEVVEEGKGGKSAASVFTSISYDEADDTSLVLCQPLTGRTHQLRIHLQQLGHPVDDDGRYGGVARAPEPVSPPPPPVERGQEEGEEGGDEQRGEGAEETEEQRLRRHRRAAFDAECEQCRDSAVYSLARVAQEVEGEDDGDGDVADKEDADGGWGMSARCIHLHAWMYDVDGDAYEVDWPDWAGGAAGLRAWKQRWAA